MREVKEKISTKELQERYAGLAEVIKEKKLFPAAVNVAMAKNNAIMTEEMKSNGEAARDIIDKFVMKDGSGEPVVKNNRYVFETAENEKAYIGAMEELNNLEFECRVQKVSRNIFDEKHEEPTAYDLVLLDFMLED